MNEEHNLVIDQSVVRPIREVVLESLREAIINGHFKPGDHLVERELAKKMGISTTPIKEAMRVLEYEGLVTRIPRKGTYVSENVNTTIKEILLLRASLEGLAAKLAALKATEEQIARLEALLKQMDVLSRNKNNTELTKLNSEFHNLITEMCQNRMITNILKTIRSFDLAFRKRALQHDEQIDKGFAEHKGIFEAIIAHQPELAEQRMKEHIYRTINEVL